MLPFKKSYIIIALIFQVNFMTAQNLTGTWEGDLGNTEFLQVNIVHVDDVLCGYTWDYLWNNRADYCKAYFAGNFDTHLNRWVLTGTSFLANSGQHVLMRLVLSYRPGDEEDILSGTEVELSFPLSRLNVNFGQRVFLRKVSGKPRSMTSNMRDCIKALKENESRKESEDITVEKLPPPMLPKPPSVKKDSVARSKTPTVVRKKAPVRSAPPTIVKKKEPVKINPPVTKPTVKASPPVTRPITNIKPKPVKSGNKSTNEAAKSTPPKRTDSVLMKPKLSAIATVGNRDSGKIVKLISTRKNKEMKHLIVNEKNITLYVYDNGIIDSDTVSVFYNGKLLLSHKLLSEKPIIIPISLDDRISEHEITLFAENLGSIPPNTALVVVHAGDKRYELFASASLTENAVISFEYQPK